MERREWSKDRRATIAILREAGWTDEEVGFSIGQMVVTLDYIDSLEAENQRLRQALEDIMHMPVMDGLDEDIPDDDKESAYRKGYEDATVDAFVIADNALKEEDTPCSSKPATSTDTK